MTNFHSLVVKHNDFGQQACAKLLPILSREWGEGHLEELRLITCQTSSDVMTKILDTIE
jgi:hypothetical protein